MVVTLLIDGTHQVRAAAFDDDDDNQVGLYRCCYYPPFASIAKGEVFVLLYVFFLFVCSVNDFSATRGPIHAIFCMRA